MLLFYWNKQLERSGCRSLLDWTRPRTTSHMIQAGATEVNLIRLDLEANMDAKLASLIMDVATQRHVVSLELQAIFFIYATYLS